MHDCNHQSQSRLNFLAASGAAATMLLPGTRALAQAPPKRKLFDVHHHHYPPELMTVTNAWQAKHGLPPVSPAFWTPEKSMTDMDANGTTTAILSLSSPHGVWFDADPAAIPALARACNDYAMKMIRDRPGRYGLFAALPMPNVDASLKEIAYAFDTLHCDGIGLPTSFGNRWPGDAAFDPVWAELNRRKSIVAFHPYAPNCCAGLQPDVAESYVEYPYDTARTFLSLLMSGTLVKYRDIRWMLCHGGGPLPSLAGRIVTLAANSHAKLEAVAPNGIDAEIKRMYYDTANATFPATMAGLLKEVPISQILYGTDYPYVTGKQNLGPLESQGISASDIVAIESGNAMRLIPRLRA